MTALARPEQKEPQHVSKSGRKLTVTRKVRAAIQQMVWHGLKRDEAAAAAGLTDHSLYVALRSPHVKAYYLAECEVLRTSGRARRIHRLEQMVEQDDNKQAVVNAVRALELMSDDDGSAVARANTLPGLQIVIQTGSPQPPTIDVTPNSELAHD
jgi:hypothetical protein